MREGVLPLVLLNHATVMSYVILNSVARHMVLAQPLRVVAFGLTTTTVGVQLPAADLAVAGMSACGFRSVMNHK